MCSFYVIVAGRVLDAVHARAIVKLSGLGLAGMQGTAIRHLPRLRRAPDRLHVHHQVGAGCS